MNFEATIYRSFQASSNSWFHAITSMDKDLVKEIEKKRLCDDADLYAAILAVSTGKSVYYDAFRTGSARWVPNFREPIIGNVLTALSSLHSLQEDARANETYYRDLFGPGKIACCDLSYFHEAILMVVSGPEGRVYHSESLRYPAGTHVPKPDNVKATKDERASQVDEGALVKKSLFVTQVLPGLKLPNFKIGSDTIQWWIHVDSCLRTDNPHFVSLRTIAELKNRNNICRLNVPAGPRADFAGDAEQSFKILKVNLAPIHHDQIVAEHLAAAGYMVNLNSSFPTRTKFIEAHQASSEDKAVETPYEILARLFPPTKNMRYK